MPAIRTSAPSAEPWTLAEVKAHLRVDSNDEDTYIGMLLSAAREAAEDRLGRTLCTTSWRMVLDCFTPVIQLPNPRAIAVANVQYVDAAGGVQTLDPAEYLVDKISEPARLVPAYGKSWPATQARVNAVTVDYTAGYGPAVTDVPMPIRQWILLAVSELYRNRGLSADVKTMPHDFAASLLDFHKIWSL